MRLQAGSLSVLFADGPDAEAQAALVRSDVDPASGVLVAPHHLTPEFLEAVNPQMVVLFADGSARAKLPGELFQTLEGTQTLRIDERGTVDLIVDAEGVGLRTEG